jgi:periplasmic divalent cation tolerance protein
MEHTATHVVLMSAPDEDTALAIARSAVEERLAACANLLPGVRSIYRWQDDVQDEREVLVIFKTVERMVPRLVARIEELHPYDVPEALALPVHAGSAAYLRWVAANADGQASS